MVLVLSACSPADVSSTKGIKKAPDIQADIFYPKNQPSFHLSSVNSAQPVLVVFWATWCPTCVEEIPKLNKLVSKYQDKIAIVTVNVQEEAAQVETFLAKKKIDFPVLLDPQGQTANRFEVTALPLFCFLPKGEKFFIMASNFQINRDWKLY